MEEKNETVHVENAESEHSAAAQDDGSEAKMNLQAYLALAVWKLSVTFVALTGF